ncbi:MAG TPA: hypothetical protein VGJ96_00350 [Gemmatimonadaceae bacterium]|jgi:hypothetical protein
MLSILVLSTGCDKAKKESADDRPPPPSFDVSTKPPLVFQAFGNLDSTRLVPIAAVIDGTVKAIVLPGADWRRLDSLYFQPGTEYPVYRDGQLAGAVTVTRRMWQPDSEPLYFLPGCREVRPMAEVKLKTQVSLDPAFEFLSLSTPLKGGNSRGQEPPDVTAAAREVALLALRTQGLDAADIDTAAFSARAIHMSNGGGVTLVANQVDPNAGDQGPGAGHTTHFLVLGDNPDGKGYQVTYKHLESGEARLVEFQRMLDHLDLTGDGTDEVFLESWRYAGTNELIVLSRANGKWHEALRVPQAWCLRQR